MNLEYIQVLIIVFTLISILCQALIIKFPFGYTFIVAPIYLFLVYWLLFPFSDWYTTYSTTKNIHISGHSHNDMEFDFMIVIVFVLLGIANVCTAVYRKWKKVS